MTHKFIREITVKYKAAKKPAPKIRDPQDIANFILKNLTTNLKEHVFAIYLDGSHIPISFSTVCIGLQNYCTVHPREVLQPAIACGAVALVIAHNHPSGDLTPSNEDRKITIMLKEASEVVGIKLLDHVIASDQGYYSFKESDKNIIF